MSPLAKKVIEKISNNEEDTDKKYKKLWDNIQEVEPDAIEEVICKQYQGGEQKLIDFDDLVQELGLDE